MEIQEQVEAVPSADDLSGSEVPEAASGLSPARHNTPKLENIPIALLRSFKEAALSDRRLAYLTKRTEDEVRAYRKTLGLIPVYKRVDTCGAEFESHTPYLYSTYEEEDEAQPTARQKIMILGSGPIASARASNSTTAVATRRLRCTSPALKRSWSTVIRKPYRPITTPPIVCTLNP